VDFLLDRPRRCVTLAPMATKQRTSWRRWLLLAIAAIGAWQLVEHLTVRSGTEKLINQLWVERMPRDAREMVWHLVALDQGGRHLGALGRSSRWRVISDGLVWRQQGDQFTFVTPQNRCRSTLKARTWKCAGEAPRPFELCLDLESGGKHYRYFSREDWAINPREQLLPHGEAAFAAAAVQTALAAPELDETVAEKDTAGECPPLQGP
jgi:hypothetical protein